jgi:Tol biopolymer transport system component
MGDRDAARNELQGLIEKRATKYVSAINIASGFAVLNETDEMFQWFETALAERDSNLTWLNVDREFDYVRDDPRFAAILRKVNLTDGLDTRNIPSPEIEVEPVASRDTAVATGPPKRTWLNRALIGAAAAAVGIAGYYLIPFSIARSAREPEKNTLVRLTDAPFDDFSPTFTRDGKIRFARFVDKHSPVSYIMNADGTGLREQTEIPGMSSGVLSPDETKIFYHKGPGDPNFYLANADGSNERVMPFHPGNALWSPDSKQFLYQAKGPDSPQSTNNSDIFIYTIDTGKITPIVESPFFDSDPAFSPDGKRIVYASDMEGNFELYSRVIATGETKRLTHGPGHESFPSYSPDGTQIIFNSDAEKENNDVYLMNVDGSNVRKITDGPGWDACPPNSWSADGTQILLLSDRAGKENIYLMNIEPFAPRRIAPTIESDQSLSPSLSPDGQQIVYQLSNEIRIFDIASQTDRFVFETSAGGGPSFSPDGKRILFQERIDDNTEICSVNIDGSGFTNITQSPSKDMTPAYSPDGSEIAFSANRAAGTTTFEIYVINSDGSEPRLVFGDRAMSVGPVWAPDGKSLLFANDREGGRTGNFELFSISLDGGTEKRLTERPGYDVDGAFSPDGSRIAFVSQADGNSEIYVMNADGTGVLRVTRDAKSDVSPRWSPDGKKLIFTSDRSGKYALYEIDV